MSVDRRDANKAMLSEAQDTQNKTKESLLRTQQQALQTEQLGAATLETLRAQGRQLDDINTEVQNVNVKLSTASGLQDRYERWAKPITGLFGGDKKKSEAEASAELAARAEQEKLNSTSRAKEVYENEKYETLKRTWKPKGMFLCSDPEVSAGDVFDPATQVASANGSKWVIDFSVANIDSEGWTYANSFDALNKSGTGTAAAAWNTYVRRRKWKYLGKDSGNETMDGIRGRQAERAEKNRVAGPGGAAGAGAAAGGMAGYSGRTQMKASGLAHVAKGKKAEALDDETRAEMDRLKLNDREIDDGISIVSNSLDNLAGIARNMKEETLSQNKKLEQLETNMHYATDKQAVVNARQKTFLKNA